MFESIKEYILEKRIDLDFRKYEFHRRCEHEQLAYKRFSTKDLEDEKKKLRAKITAETSTKFDVAINEKEVQKTSCQIMASDTESKLAYFLEDYKKQLDELYSEKDTLTSKKADLYARNTKVRESLSEAFDNKDKAYSELNYYKDRIDSWYAKSERTPWLFGNGGKKLPKHSIFGQSFGDLDSYKSRRDSAYDDAKKAKDQIDSLKQEQQELNAQIAQAKNEIGKVFDQINQVKKNRAKMYELKEAGHHRRNLQSTLDNLNSEIQKLNSEINGIKSDKQEYVVYLTHRYGVVDLDAKIKEIEQKRKQFLDSFDLEKHHQERKQLHRQAWFKQRGMV